MIPVGVLQGPWLLCAALVLVAAVIRRGPWPLAGRLWLVGAITVCVGVAHPALSAGYGEAIEGGRPALSDGAAITPAFAQALYDRVAPLREADGCRLTRLDTGRFRIALGLQASSGEEQVLEVSTAAARDAGARVAGEWTLAVPAVVERDCPATLAALERVLSGLRAPSPLAVGGSDPAAPGLAVGAALFVLAAAGLLLALAEMLQHRSRQAERLWFWVGLGCFALALCARLAVHPAPANWYSEIATSDQPWAGTRFGPAEAVFQRLLAALLPWSDRTLFDVNILLGALTVPLFLAALRALAVDVRVALGVGILLALSPFHVRISASSSEHVLSGLLTVLALVLWLQGVASRRWTSVVAGLSLLPLTCFLRADAFTQLVALPLWAILPWWRVPVEAAPPRRWRWIAAGAWIMVLAAVAFPVWWLVVVPSHHPRPDLGSITQVLGRLFAQYPAVALKDPHWIPLVAVLLAAVGAVYLGLRRPGLLACLLLTLVTCFGLLGRSLESDGLLGARYLLLTEPVFLTLSGYGVLVIAEIAGRWWPVVRQPGGAAFLAALAGIGAAVGSYPAYRYEYAFQEEYGFLREALRGLRQGCTVYQLAVRVEGFERDLDCCLDVPRSPLVAAYPGLVFRSLDAASAGARVLVPNTEGACVVYYEGSACALAATAEARTRHATALAYFQRRCPEMRSALRNGPRASAAVVSHATNDLFGSASHAVHLYEVHP